MIRITTYIIYFLLIAFHQLVSNQGNTSSKKNIAVKTNDAISIDGILSEEAWQRSGFT